MLFSILIFFEYENLELINKSKSKITASKYFIFIIDAFEKIASDKFVVISKYPTISTYVLLFLLLIISFNLEKNSLNVSYNRFDENEYQLLILSSLILIIMFFVFDNVYYREIFLIGCLPFFIKYQREKYLKYLLYFIIFRYFVFILARIILKEYGTDWLYVFKNLLDLFLISNLMIIIIYFTRNYYKKLFQLV